MRARGTLDKRRPTIEIRYTSGRKVRVHSYEDAGAVLGLYPHTVACKLARGPFTMSLPDFWRKRMDTGVRVTRLARSRD